MGEICGIYMLLFTGGRKEEIKKNGGEGPVCIWRVIQRVREGQLINTKNV